MTNTNLTVIQSDGFAPEAQQGRRFLIWRAVIVLGLLMSTFAGYIKGSPLVREFVPGDPTLWGTLITALAIGIFCVRSRFTLPHGFEFLVTIVVALGFGLLMGGDTGYSTNKIVSLFLITIPSMVGAFLLLRNERARSWWVFAVIGMGALVTILAIVDPNQDVAVLGDRIAVEGSNTIGAGRATGAAVVVCISLAMGVGRRRLSYTLMALILSVAMVASGSRGPLLAAVIAVLVVALASSRKQKSRRMAFAFASIVAGGWAAIHFGLVSTRLTQTGGLSFQYRQAMWSETLAIMGQHPFGIGWGNLYHHLSAASSPASGERQYPHNIVLEIGSEAGILAVLAIATIFFVGFYWQRRAACTPVEMAMFGLLVFLVLSAMVSGDVNDNRGVWLMIGAALATRPRASRSIMRSHICSEET